MKRVLRVKREEDGSLKKLIKEVKEVLNEELKSQEDRLKEWMKKEIEMMENRIRKEYERHQEAEKKKEKENKEIEEEWMERWLMEGGELKELRSKMEEVYGKGWQKKNGCNEVREFQKRSYEYIRTRVENVEKRERLMMKMLDLSMRLIK